MSIARIGQFQAKPETIHALREFMLSIMPLIKDSAGCVSCELFQSQADATQFTMVEIWDSVEAHKASVKNIPPDKLREIAPLIAAPPSGNYFDTVAKR